MGPFALLDLVGLDTSVSILDALYTEFRDPNYAAVPLLRRMVAAGHLGPQDQAGLPLVLSSQSQKSVLREATVTLGGGLTRI